MRNIGVVTVGRSDFGIYRPILLRIQSDSSLRLDLYVGGTSEPEGFPVIARVEHLEEDDSPEAIAVSMGRGTVGFAQAFAHERPDILVVLGDRFEMHAAALAALPFKIPVAHIHGGELTEGAFDDALRHSITKLSHLHFVSTEEYRRRVIQLGEEPWRVTVSGAPGLDNLRDVKLLSPQELGISEAPLLVTFHPVTLEYERTEWQSAELLAALEEAGQPVVFTMPNADTHNQIIRRQIEEFVRSHKDAQAFETLGTQRYFSLMACAAAMVGNSSSGLIEAPSFNLPVVNVGTRQRGRVRAANVIDVGYSRADILKGIYRALEPEFRQGLFNLQNPYGNGHAAEIIMQKLQETPLGDWLLVKKFFDMGHD